MVTKPAFPGICAFPLTGNSERSQLSGWDIFKNFTPKNLWVRAVKSFLLSLFFCLYWVILLWSGQFYTINYVERQLSLSPYLFVRPAGEAHRHAGKGEGAGLHSVKKKTKLLSYLRNIHNRVTAERPSRCQIIGTQYSGDYSILINPPDHGAIHKVNQPKLIHSDAWKESKKDSQKLMAAWHEEQYIWRHSKWMRGELGMLESWLSRALNWQHSMEGTFQCNSEIPAHSWKRAWHSVNCWNEKVS